MEEKGSDGVKSGECIRYLGMYNDKVFCVELGLGMQWNIVNQLESESYIGRNYAL